MLRTIALLALPFLTAAACGGSTTDAPAADSEGSTPDAAAARGSSATDDAGGPATGGDADAGAGPTVLFPRTGIGPDELAVIVNDSDALSVQVAAYYIAKRNIPAANVIHVTLASRATMSEADFTPIKANVDAALATTKAQAQLLTWTKPFAVGNMSITSAFAMGYHAIVGSTCTDPYAQSLAANPYLQKPMSTAPFTDLAFRPTMTLPATTLAEAQAIVDHGVAADDTQPKGTAYLMDTTDQTRSARCILDPSHGYYNECQSLLNELDTASSGIAASIVKANSVKNATDVLFYVKGLASVPDITTNTYLPGAIADHLTSFGGQIPTSGQMSAFEFLRAGATGSYGTVVEPCAYVQKFPNPAVLVPRYFGGATLIEAYWKSVEWPAEGIFIGEPLARPFGTGYASKVDGDTLTIATTAMVPGTQYLVEAADAEAGPFTTVRDNLMVQKYQRSTFTFPATRKVYRFRQH